jgi:hypothetical protein
MGACRMLAAALAAGVLITPTLLAQQPAAPSTASAPEPSPAEIKQELEKIKKGRTFGLAPAGGTDDSGGATLLRLDNASPFDLVVLVVGPVTQRIELGPDRMRTLAVVPGDYEIAVTAVGRDVPPFYGKQKIVENMLFRQKFIIPGV